MKKKLWIAGVSVAALIALVPVLLSLTGAIDVFGLRKDGNGDKVVLKGTEMSLGSSFSLKDGMYTLSLPNATRTYVMTDAVATADNAAWYLCSDEFGAEKIPGKTVPLEVGDNVYYILVVNGDDYTVYPVLLRVRPMYTVRYELNNGESMPDCTVEEGETVTLRDDLYLRGHSLLCWRDDNDAAAPRTVTIERDTVFTAVWEARTFTVTYDPNIGAVGHLSEQVVYGQAFTPILATGDVYNEFYGWFYENGLFGECVYDIDKSITLTAKWTSTVFTVSNKNLITGLTDFGKSLETLAIPAENNGVTVTGIADGAFSNRTSIVRVILPDSLETVGDFAFSGCLSLNTVTTGVNSRLSRIGAYALNNTAWLSLQSGLVYLGNVLYTATGNVSGVVSLRANTVSIAANAFKSCTQITGIAMPSTLTHIGDEAFCGCTNLAELTLSDNITNVGRYAFKDTAWLSNQPEGLIYINKVAYIYKGDMKIDTVIEIKTGTTAIADYAFTDCMRLRQVIMPDGLVSIGAYAFRGCYALREITLPNSVANIGTGAFSNCIYLQSVTLSGCLTRLADGLFSGCESLSAINLTDGIVSIGEYCFEGCTSLTALNLSASLTSIGEYAFFNCTGLKNIYIGAAVTKVGAYAFYNCNSLSLACGHAFKPNTWSDKWNPSERPVEWGTAA